MDFEIGMFVIFADRVQHALEPAYYPKVGTVGEIVEIEGDNLRVQWPENSTSDDDLWYCYKNDVVLVGNNKGCEWCEIKDGTFRLGEILFFENHGNEMDEVYFPLKYCPNCGRKLYGGVDNE